jgi:three-Cys-motif partner protein
MMEHQFGGGWTQEKLERLQAYLLQYRSIFEHNANAKYFTTWYVDAFAGTGTRSNSSISANYFFRTDEENADEDADRFLAGSTKIALNVPSPFHRYLFIEASKKKAQALRSMVDMEFPLLGNRVEVQVQDANIALCNWCNGTDWQCNRAVVFLDPFGMQVEWNTIETLARTKGVDLWYLFPIVARLLTRDGIIDETWRKRLDLLFGTTDWPSRFYQVKTRETLFGQEEDLVRDATVENIQSFIQERLQTCFVAVADSHILRNSKQSPLFALCFAASNEKGAKPALRIAQHLLGM